MTGILGRVARHKLAVVAALMLVVIAVRPASADAPVGSSGTDVSLPATDSKLTLSGRGAFSDLKVTVNQTKRLLNQAISVTWSGGAPTRSGPNQFAANYMQVMQCWGDDDGSHPDNPGPPPEQCEYGATSAKYGGSPTGLFPPGSFATQRIIGVNNWSNYDPNVGFTDSNTGLVWRSFRAVDGKQIDTHIDPKFDPSIQGGQYWLNPYFDFYTTNEVSATPTGSNGVGTQLFEVDTGIESSGLGCGQQVQPTSGGGTVVPKCWLVVVPRGTPANENAGTPYGGDNADSFGDQTSPLAPTQWQNRISFPLDFNPVDSPCSIGAKEVRLGGTELATPAVISWQPKLCDKPSAPPYVYSTISDAAARQQLVQSSPGAPGLVAVTRPIDQDKLDAASPVVYVPLTLSGTVIAFNVERTPTLNAPSEEKALFGSPVAHLNLTPRLLAKLLTQSYAQQVNIEGATPYDWAKHNPSQIAEDPDFLQFNPEFSLLSVANRKDFGGLLMPVTNSDVAYELWNYVLADPEAKGWLDGNADPWGMTVNPVYITKASANPSGIAFGDPTPAAFPKSDPFCYQGGPTGANGTLTPPPLCGTDWMPYTESLRDSAHLVRAADDHAKDAVDPFAISPDAIWTRGGPQALGSRAMLGVTDSASAFRYGVQSASLSPAGDDGANRTFVAPDVKGFTAGVDAMKPQGEKAVLEPDPSAKNSSAYPLTMLTYGAIKPLALDATAREQYATFVDYASGPGQTPGQQLGQLPPGYAPLPSALQTQAKQAADTIRHLKPAAAEAEGATPEVASEAAAAPVADVAAPLAEEAPAMAEVAADVPMLQLISGAPLTALTPPTPTSPSPVASLPGIVKKVLTPVIAVAASRYVLPILGVVALLALLGAVEITKRPRRATARAADHG